MVIKWRVGCDVIWVKRKLSEYSTSRDTEALTMHYILSAESLGKSIPMPSVGVMSTARVDHRYCLGPSSAVQGDKTWAQCADASVGAIPSALDAGAL